MSEKQTIQWSRQKIISALIDLESRREGLSVKVIKKSNAALYAAARRHFGSWGLALAAAGIKLPSRHRKQINDANRTRWTQENIIETILRCAVNRQPLLSSKVRPASLRIAATRVFGSWYKALCVAGVEPSGGRYQKWSKERIKRELLTRLKNKKSIHPSDIHQDDPKLRAAIDRWFDGWADSFLYAGICPGMAEKSRKNTRGLS
ncbi:MAG: hypothetical protein H8E17_18460 [Deltaproteobacteria bacterium]|nr:hypothetical protein [Deltaproteobacteria bacterium]